MERVAVPGTVDCFLVHGAHAVPGTVEGRTPRCTKWSYLLIYQWMVQRWSFGLTRTRTGRRVRRKTAPPFGAFARISGHTGPHVVRCSVIAVGVLQKSARQRENPRLRKRARPHHIQKTTIHQFLPRFGYCAVRPHPASRFDFVIRHNQVSTVQTGACVAAIPWTVLFWPFLILDMVEVA